MAAHHCMAIPRLRPGDQVRLVSPGSSPDAALVQATSATLTEWGLRVQVGAHARDEWGFMAGRDADRLADLNEVFGDPQVRAIIATRGGAGKYRIADDLDFAAVRRDPKPVLGFSDIVDLHLALWRECRLPTIHGCVIGQRAASSARALLMDAAELVLGADPTATSAQVWAPGLANGPVIGGNLAALTHRVGTGLPDLTGAILLIEDTRQIGLGRIDRQFTQLRRSGALAGLAGVALGLITGFDTYVDRGWTIVDVLRDHLLPLGVPVLGGLPIGHGGRLDSAGNPDQTCVWLGSAAILDADRRRLIVTSPLDDDLAP